MRNITLQGKPINVLGKELKPGDVAPDFTVVDKEMQSVKLSDFKGKVVVINSVPSIDTPVCDMQVRRFNAEASKLKDVIILSVSVDLPFALAKYCAAAGIDAVKTTSDYQNLDFGNKYGTLIDGLKLLTRAVIIIGKDGTIKYIEYVKEVSDSPNFDKALETIKSLI